MSNKAKYHEKIDEDFKEIKVYFSETVEVIKNGREFEELNEEEKKAIRLIHKSLIDFRNCEKHFKNIAYVCEKFLNIKFNEE